MQQAYTCMENKDNFTEQASFYSERYLFYSMSSNTRRPLYNNGGERKLCI